MKPGLQAFGVYLGEGYTACRDLCLVERNLAYVAEWKALQYRDECATMLPGQAAHHLFITNAGKAHDLQGKSVRDGRYGIGRFLRIRDKALWSKRTTLQEGAHKLRTVTCGMVEDEGRKNAFVMARKKVGQNPDRAGA